MTLKLWVLAAMSLVLLGLGALIGSHYVPGFNSNLRVEFKENSCAIRCPADSAHASAAGIRNLYRRFSRRCVSARTCNSRPPGVWRRIDERPVARPADIAPFPDWL